jgi:preprotein translocase subunit SecA
MDKLNNKEMMDMLKQSGIDLSKMDPNVMRKLMQITDKLSDSDNINEDIMKQMISLLAPKKPVENNTNTKYGKVGRNAPCPCNSGQKWKKCCGKVK